MSSAYLHRTLLLALALPCLSAGALADTPAAPTPIGQSASATAAQGGPVVRSHGHDVRSPDSPAPAITPASGATVGSSTAGSTSGSAK